MQPHAGGRVYVNFLGDEGAERVRQAYGDRQYERLVELKRAYDPTNFFRLNQNIEPSRQLGGHPPVAEMDARPRLCGGKPMALTRRRCQDTEAGVSIERSTSIRLLCERLAEAHRERCLGRGPLVRAAAV